MPRLRNLFPGFLALLFLGAVGLLGWRVFRQHEIARTVRIAVPPGMDELRPVPLGGIEQWISLRGHDRGKPLLLFLHGGPGFPQMPFAENNALLEHDFVVVQWDQRGAGKSFQPSIPSASMRLQQFVSDAHELVALLRAQFGGRKIFLCAHSWGTLPGALLVARYPDDFLGYIGVSQIADMMSAEKELYNFALGYAGEHQKEKAVVILQELGPPPHQTEKALKTVADYAHEFGQQIHPQTRPNDLLPRAFVSPQYSLRNWIDILRGARFSSAHLWRESYRTNLFQRVPRLEVQVLLISGRYDFAVTGTVARRYYEALEAPRGKRFLWFERSSHFPNFEEPEHFAAALREFARQTSL